MKSISKNPFILLNFKTYTESSGKSALNLAKICEKISNETGITIAIAPQYMDIYQLSQLDIPIFSQHIDPITPGGHTGSVLLDCAIEAGVCGTLINHSEKRMNLADIENTIQLSSKQDIYTILCTNNLKTSQAAALFKPTFIAIEPPELIGSGIPVSQVEPEIVEKTVKSVKKIDPTINILCGAGISTGDDLRAALDLGTSGVLLASGIIKTKNQEKSLLDLVSKI